MIPNQDDEQDPQPLMIIKHISKELFVPLLYYIYTDECEVIE